MGISRQISRSLTVIVSGEITINSHVKALGDRLSSKEISELLVDRFLPQVFKPGQYLGNEWGARRKPFASCDVRLALCFPDMYELGMSNFGLKILYQLVNDFEGLLVDRSYAPADDLEKLMRESRPAVPLFAFESRQPIYNFELVGFSLQYELTYSNVLNMLDLAQLPVKASERTDLFPLVFGGGPSSVNPEPMAPFMDFFIIGDGELAIPAVMNVVRQFKADYLSMVEAEPGLSAHYRQWLLLKLAVEVPGVYAPSLYDLKDGDVVVTPIDLTAIVDGLVSALPQHKNVLEQLRGGVIPKRVLRQIAPLTEANQPTTNLVPYLALVHDRETLEVRRGCDRGCRFCQPGYTFLPVRERSAQDLVELSKKALANSGHEEYSLLSLCVSDYTSLHDSVRALNREHSATRASLSFPSQRADRMNLEIAEELKAVRKSGITLAPEAGTEKLRAVINKGLSHQQIISAIESAYQSGWASVKLYFMCGLPFEDDSDLQGIIDILKEAEIHCNVIKRTDPVKYKKGLELTCTISNFVPKPFTPFQWFGQVDPRETARRHGVLRAKLREAGLRKVTLNVTDPAISLLEAAISRGDRLVGELIYRAWKAGAVFDAWDDRYKPEIWHTAAESLGLTLEGLACPDLEVGSRQPFDVVHIGLHDFWLKREWEKAVNEVETAACTENVCHACGICTELDTTHILANPIPAVMKKNPFVKELNANTSDSESHPSLFFVAPRDPVKDVFVEQSHDLNVRLRFAFTKVGDLRFIGHLDMQNLLIRAARRASLQMAYTQGFNPSPKLALACPLPLFQEGLRELADIELTEQITCEEFMQRINRQLPPEVQIIDCVELPKLLPINGNAQATPSIASMVTSARYRAELHVLQDSLLNLSSASDSSTRPNASTSEMVEAIKLSIDELMESEHLYALVPEADPKAKTKGKNKDAQGKNLRPGIISLNLVSSALNDDRKTLALEFEIATGSGFKDGTSGHIKPTDLLALICPTLNLSWRVTRCELVTQPAIHFSRLTAI